jgi:hypothetical protein
MSALPKLSGRQVAKVFKKFDWRNRYSSKQMFEVLYLWNWLCLHRFTSNRL